jgi:hypothetical protein
LYYVQCTQWNQTFFEVAITFVSLYDRIAKNNYFDFSVQSKVNPHKIVGYNNFIVTKKGFNPITLYLEQRKGNTWKPHSISEDI